MSTENNDPSKAREPEAAPLREALVTSDMVTAYLKANDEYWKQTDALPQPPAHWRNGNVKEATAVSLAAALEAAPQAPAAEVPTDRAAFMAWFKRHTGEDATLKSARYFAFTKTASVAFDAWVAAPRLRPVAPAAADVQGEPDEYKTLYEEAMVASNEAGFVGLSAAETIRALDKLYAAPKVVEVLATEHEVDFVAYTGAIGEAGQKYMDRFKNHAHPLPVKFRWEELWNAMREAAQQGPAAAQGEPVAEIVRDGTSSPFSVSWLRAPGPAGTLLYAAPKVVERLTDEQFQDLWVSGVVGPFAFARAIENHLAAQWGVTLKGNAS